MRAKITLVDPGPAMPHFGIGAAAAMGLCTVEFEKAKKSEQSCMRLLPANLFVTTSIAQKPFSAKMTLNDVCVFSFPFCLKKLDVAYHLAAL